MEPEPIVNLTYVVNKIHSCYELGNASYILLSSASTVCVLLSVICGTLCAVTIGGNVLVIIAVVYFKQLHTPTNYLILSLAVADLLVGVVIVPFSMAFSVSSCWNEDLFCKVRDSFDISLCMCSILNLCCISIDRYFAVCQPLTYKTKINDQVVAAMILVSWTISALIGLGVILSGLNPDKCEENCSNNILLANVMGLILSFYLPVMIMLCIYLKIFLVAQKQARSIQSMKAGGSISKVERKATATLAIILGVFLCCWTPFYFCMTFLSFSRESVSIAVFETLNWLALSNSMLNPFIYAFFYSWFRTAFRMIVSGKIFQGDFSDSKLL
ncbi:trace amine-associated receptor 1-like [Brachionichthys hirsutus]|uniref:trace amine-associated receptor 1-like n=1 Tax=Brachionichthys hirsutus TaxID=412623 RepID=UPI0036045334